MTVKQALAQQGDLDRQLDQLLQERDHRDEIINKLCDAVLGTDRNEWSSMYFFEDAVREVEERMYALSQQGEQQPVAKYIGECHDGSLVQLYEDLKKGTELYAGASPAPQAQREPDWSNSETGINELWKNPAHSMADRLRMADGAVAFRDKTIANLRHQLKQQSE